METLALFVVAIILFIIFHRIVNVTYFGFKGVIGTAILCLVIAAPIVRFTFSFIANYYGWIIAGIVIIVVLITVNKNKSNPNTRETSGDGN